MQAEVNRPQCDHASPLFVAAENAHAAGDCRNHRRFGLQEFDGSVKVKFPIQAVFGKSKTKNFHQLCIIFGQFFLIGMFGRFFSQETQVLKSCRSFWKRELRRRRVSSTKNLQNLSHIFQGLGNHYWNVYLRIYVYITLLGGGSYFYSYLGKWSNFTS